MLLIAKNGTRTLTHVLKQQFPILEMLYRDKAEDSHISFSDIYKLLVKTYIFGAILL